MNPTTEQLSKPQLIAYRSLYRSRIKHSKLNQWFPHFPCSIYAVFFQTVNKCIPLFFYHCKSLRNHMGEYEIKGVVYVK